MEWYSTKTSSSSSKDGCSPETTCMFMHLITAIVLSIVLTSEYLPNVHGWSRFIICGVFVITFLFLLFIPIIGVILCIGSTVAWLFVILNIISLIKTTWLKRILMAIALFFIISCGCLPILFIALERTKKLKTKKGSKTAAVSDTHQEINLGNSMDALTLTEIFNPKNRYALSSNWYYFASDESEVIFQIVETPEFVNGNLVQGYEVNVISRTGETLEQITNINGNEEFAAQIRQLKEKYNMKDCKRFNDVSLAWNYAATNIQNSIPASSYYSRFTTLKNNFQIYNAHLTGTISPELITSIITAQTAITYMNTLFEKPNARIKQSEVAQIEQLLRNIESANTLMFKHYNTTASSHTSYHSSFQDGNGHSSQNTEHSYSECRQKNSDIDESLFSGCTDKESLTKRYRQLMKTFHPDNQNGDHAMTQKIQHTYEVLSKHF